MEEKAKEARRAYKRELNSTGRKKKKTKSNGMSEQAREARRAYKREWNRRNKDKVKAANERYWNRGRELARILNIDIRDVSRNIEKERRNGAPICAGALGTQGYYLAADQEELIEYCGRLHRKG